MKRSDIYFRPTPSASKTLLIGAALTLVLALVLAAPIAYVSAVGASDRTLARVSNVGQAYGAVSALLSVIALCAVAGSVFYQARQDRATSAAFVREGQRQLLGYIIAEPSVFLPCIVDSEVFDSEKKARQYSFTTLWLGLCRQAYEIGYHDEEAVRKEFAETMFRSALARELWPARKAMMGVDDVDMGPFFNIFEQEYRKASGVDARRVAHAGVDTALEKAGPEEGFDAAQTKPAPHDPE